MLYLPPQYAHDGIAEGECMTCSIGFRAPAYRELAGHFARLSETVEDNEALSGRYSDAGQNATEHPAQMPADLVRAVSTRLKAMRWSEADVSEFLGAHLSEPKPTVEFREPSSISLRKFENWHEFMASCWLLPRSPLYDRNHFFSTARPTSHPRSWQNGYASWRIGAA